MKSVEYRCFKINNWRKDKMTVIRSSAFLKDIYLTHMCLDYTMNLRNDIKGITV